jgi:multiple RNA-binding domain-containing protein 1
MRIIVKNLPKFIEKSQIEKEFSSFGKITDIHMLVDSKGSFRRVCYIGYPSDDIRDQVIKKMNNSYILNHKIQVEVSTLDKKVVTESDERIIKYNNKILIKNIPDLSLEDIKNELSQYGSIKNISKNGEGRILLEYTNVEDTLKVFKEVSTLCGRLVKMSPYKENTKMMTYYNSLFFNFDSVIKHTCENERLMKNEVVDLQDKDLGTKISLLETNLVNETDKFLRMNNIYLDRLTDKKNKKVLIVRNIEVSRVLDFVNCKCKMEASPSKNLVLLKFKNEEDAYKCYKSINLRRFNDTVIYCEYAPMTDKVGNGMEDDTDKVGNGMEDNKNKLLIKNVPFQATQKDIANLFKKKFKVQGIRLPIKRDGTPRGFAFITFDTKKTLLKAIEYFGKSTHLYGRRLVLEIAKE